MRQRTKAELISQVLQRIAEGRFNLRSDEDGEIISILNYGPSLDEKARPFRELLGQLYHVQIEMLDANPEDPNAAWDSPFAEENWSDFWTEQLLALWLGEEAAPQLTERFRGHSYEQVISRLYDAWNKIHREQATSFVDARERLASLEESLREAELLDRSADEVIDLIADEYAFQLGVRFPKIIRRAEKLRVLPADQTPPPEVQKYLQQATRCYIFGFYIGALVLCRSAIELAIRERLKAHGKADVLDRLERAREDTIDKLIDLAKAELPWDLREVFEFADTVRREANKAAHGDEPGPERCKEMFDVTRGALKELYSVRPAIWHLPNTR